jgi:ATP-binding cassette subfamily B protein
LALPFLTQAIVDTGIRHQDFSFIVLILIAQLALMASLSMVEIIRERILLHISTRINFSMVRDFLSKIMKLPIRLFDRGMTGDLLQRIADQTRVESFLTSGSIRVAFSTFNLLLFSLILSFYSANIFLIFIFGSIIHLGWVILFLKKRKHLDRHKFMQLSEHQTRVLEIIHGMKDIRMSGAEHHKRWLWEEVQAGIFRTNIKTLNVNQLQDAGSFIINQSKNIMITFLAANAVIQGDITLGMMLAIQFILGQANAPVEQMSYTVREFQDAFFSLERINDIFQMENEVADQQPYHPIPHAMEISFQKVSFRYNNEGQDALCGISFTIPEGKTTALVGDSGCGKTTIMNLLLGVHTPREGKILINGASLTSLNKDLWRRKCGIVMQDGFVFNDTIAGNIALGHEEIDYDKVKNAIHTASLNTELAMFPSGVNTIVGEKGRGLSTGQKQRLLIARAIYKNPALFLFDEATNSLDANNEKIILNNLSSCLKNKTVVVAAHRLSTIINADQIIVLRDGKIVETGTHSDLISRKGHYCKLIEKQSNTFLAS